MSKGLLELKELSDDIPYLYQHHLCQADRFSSCQPKLIISGLFQSLVKQINILCACHLSSVEETFIKYRR